MKIISVLVCSLSVLILLTGVLAPVLEYMKVYELSTALYRTLGAICHQLPTRCIWIFNRPMGICSRDSGIYLGIFLSGIIFLKKRNLFSPWYGVFIIPMMIDISAKILDWHSNKLIAFLTGLGGGIGFTTIVVYFTTKIQNSKKEVKKLHRKKAIFFLSKSKNLIRGGLR
jgi:uncharacterized membrane protein